MMQRTLNGEEQAELDALRERFWRAHLPPAAAARELTRAATALPDENDSAWELQEACGLGRG